MFKLNGKKISLEVDLTVGEGEAAITYPSGSLKASPELRAQLGITEDPDPVRPDDRLFYVTENEDGTYSTVAKAKDLVTEPVWAAIKAKRDAVTLGGVKVGAKWYHSDESSRDKYHGLVRMADAAVAAGGSDTTTLQWGGQDISWKTMDGTFIKMTVKRANDVFNAVSGLDFITFGAAEVHRAAMVALDNPFEYDFSAGWPQVYADTLV